MQSKWVVHTQGQPGSDFFEISVLREDNIHGKDSYGWFGNNKIHITSSGGPFSNKISFEHLWDDLIEVAQRLADKLNTQESAK